MKKLIKALSRTLALALALTMVPQMAFAADKPYTDHEGLPEEIKTWLGGSNYDDTKITIANKDGGWEITLTDPSGISNSLGTSEDVPFSPSVLVTIVNNGTLGHRIYGSANVILKGSGTYGAEVTGATVVEGTYSHEMKGCNIQGGTISGQVDGGTISGGTFSRAVNDASISGGSFSGTVTGGTVSAGTYSAGTFTNVAVTGGTFESGATVTATTVSGEPVFKGPVTVTQQIDGGEFQGKVTATGATINNGTFENEVDGASVINDGLFTAASDVKNVDTINGGEFKGQVAAKLIKNGTFAGNVTAQTIKDGTFDGTVTADVSVDGGNYKNIPDRAENDFEVDGRHYVTEEDAVAAANASESDIKVNKAANGAEFKNLKSGKKVTVEEAAQGKDISVNGHAMTEGEKTGNGYTVPNPPSGGGGSSAPAPAPAAPAARPGRANPNTGVRL